MQNAPLELAIALAVFAAVIGPVMTFFSVRMTLRSSREQADKDATRRLEAQREAALADRKLEVYSSYLFLMSSEIAAQLRFIRDGNSDPTVTFDDDEFGRQFTQLQFLGTDAVIFCAEKTWSHIVKLDDDRRHSEAAQHAMHVSASRESWRALRNAMRVDLGQDPLPERKIAS